MTGEKTPYLMRKKIPEYDKDNPPVPDYEPAIPKKPIKYKDPEVKKMLDSRPKPMHIGVIPKPYGRQSSIPGAEVIFLTDAKHKEVY